MKQKEEIHKYQNENTHLFKSLEEKTSCYESLNIQLLETRNRLIAVEQNLKEKEERLASNDKGKTALKNIYFHINELLLNKNYKNILIVVYYG